MTLSTTPHPDMASSTDDYAARFEGPGGGYLLDVQTAAVLDLLRPWEGGSVLDVGGGHGQVCLPLARRGHRVTVVVSDPAAGDRVARHDLPSLSLLVSDLSDPAVPAGSFDVVTCFRILPHVPDWESLLVRLCTIAREAILIDFPVPAGVQALKPLLFGLKRKVERNTRPYTLIRRASVLACLRANGFESRAVHPQFFLPMVLHRMMRSQRASSALEGLFRATGLTGVFGSPVILLGARSSSQLGGGPWH